LTAEGFHLLRSAALLAAPGPVHLGPIAWTKRSPHEAVALREMSLMLAIPYPKRSRTGLEKAK
jgi:hypothetical protein